MDASSIITQVSRDDEQLNCFPQSEKVNQNGKKPRKNIFRSLFCCCLSEPEPQPAGTNGTCITEDVPFYGNLAQPTPTATRNLLPPVSHRDMHKKCMVIDLDETLVHSSFKPISNADFIVPVEIDGTVHQVYVLKRPYVDDFLQKMGELYECVLFTASLAKYADPVANLLDKWNVFRARLFRESCVFHRGNYVKDLSRLGRDLQKVVIMDNSPASYIFHPDNAVPVSSWFDDMSDSELIDLIPFLDTLSKVDNVYTVLRNCNNPLNTVSSPSSEMRGNADGGGGGGVAAAAAAAVPNVNGQGPIAQVQQPTPKLSSGGGSPPTHVTQFSPIQQQTMNGAQQQQPSGNNNNNNEEDEGGHPKEQDSVS